MACGSVSVLARCTGCAHARSRARLLLLLLEERQQGHPGHLHDLEPHAGDVAHRVAATAETGDQHLVVLVDEVEAAVVRDERRDLLAVLDQLRAAALPDGAVRLLRLNAHLLDDDALRVRRSPERLVAVARAAHRLLVVLVRPPLALAVTAQLAPGAKSARKPATHDRRCAL